MRYPHISELMILQSAAGYYIGRLYFYSEDESNPYSKNSRYFKTEEEAKYALSIGDYEN